MYALFHFVNLHNALLLLNHISNFNKFILISKRPLGVSQGHLVSHCHTFNLGQVIFNILV